MRVIILSGPDSCGKTSSLKMLFNRIKETHEVEVLEEKPVDKDFEYKVRYSDGKTLVIATQGDYEDLLKKYCEEFKNYDILVCAYNRKFMSGENPLEMVTDYDPLTTIVLKKKYVPKETHDKVNEACAEHLLELIDIVRRKIK